MQVTLQLGQADLFFPVMVRILSALMVAPVFSQRAIPTPVKIVLSGFMAWLIVSSGGQALSQHRPENTAAWLGGLAGEVLIGLLLGFLSSLVFWALNMAGELIGMQMGWNFGATLHASLESSPVATGQLFLMLGTLTFMVAGGHRLWLIALTRTFEVAPPFALTSNTFGLDRILDLVSALFTGALELALPVIGTLLLAEAFLAFLTKVLPQLNAWVFGVPLKIGVGLLVLWLVLPTLLTAIQHRVMQSPGSLLGFIP
jgi:flagellar biosynthetic protein FliR